MPKFAEFCIHANGRYDRVALVSDVRAGDCFEPLLHALDELEQMNCTYKLLFMEADLPTIIKRYKETRRLHPWRVSAIPWRTRPTGSASCSSRSGTGPPMCWIPPLCLHQYAADRPGEALWHQSAPDRPVGDGDELWLQIRPALEADLALDVRFLPNPYYVADLKQLSGKDQPVRDYLDSFQVTQTFWEKLTDFMSFLLPQYAEEGKRTLTLAIGCTGGRHRSVALACKLADWVREQGVYGERVSPGCDEGLRP